MFAAVHLRGESKAADCISDRLRACADAFSPIFDLPFPGELLIDLRGLSSLFGTAHNIASRINGKLGDLDLSANVAVAENIDTALIASRAIPGITVIPSGEERKALAPLPLQYLNADEQTADVLRAWGISTIGGLAALPERGIVERLGPAGLHLQNLSRGLVDRPLVPFTDAASFEGSIELEHPLELLEPLSFLMSRLLNEQCGRLTAHGLAANTVYLTLGLDGQCDFVRKITMPVPSRDAATFLKLLQYDLSANPPEAAILKVTIRMEPVAPRSVQNGLFTPQAPEPEKLELTLARLAAIVGKENVGSPEIIDTHRPDAYRIVRFDATKKGTSQLPDTGLIPLAIRRYRPPLAAQVHTVNGRPERLSAHGIRAKVAAWAGPWRLSGDWWTTESWKRDEWDVALENGMLLRLFRDPADNWFIDGNYD